MFGVLASARPNPRIAVSMLADTLVAGVVAFAALYLQSGDGMFNGDAWALVLAVLAFMVIAAVAFVWFGVHRGSWRYASISELWRIIKSATAAAILLVLGSATLIDGARVPLPAFVIWWLMLIVGLGGARLTYRQLQEWRQAGTAGRSPQPACPVLLFGAGRDAEFFIRAVQCEPEAGYEVVGMIDDGDRLVGRSVHGVPVLGSVRNLPAIVRRLHKRGKRPTEIIFAQPPDAMLTRDARDLLELVQASGLSVSRLSGPSKIAGFQRGRIEVEPVTLEDLLGRAQHALDPVAIARLVPGQRVLVTGAGGSIGSELVRQIAALEPASLVLTDHSEFNLYNIDLEAKEQWPKLARAAFICDVRDRSRVDRLFAEHQPDVVFHAAALKHVPLVEENPAEGVLTNVQGTINVADACVAQRAAAMVLISTDKAVNPTSVMGATKRVAEYYCQALDLSTADAGNDSQAPTRFVTVRFGNILGSSGSVVPLFQRQIAQGGPVTVTHPEMTRYFMTNREAVTLILQASAHALMGKMDRGQIFILDMGEPVQILDVARQLIELAGLTPGVDIEIEYVGLRPGEKLREALFYPHEVPVATHLDSVLAVRSEPVPVDVLRPAIEDLVSAARRNNGDSIHRMLIDILQRFDDCRLPIAERPSEAEAPPPDSRKPARAWPRPAPVIETAASSPEPAWRAAGSLG
jgi:FlaA1/EpsC-like NDP-sugar epimerase